MYNAAHIHIMTNNFALSAESTVRLHSK